MKESRKDFILELHLEAFPSRKTKIEKEFPKLFKNNGLVVGKWYKTDGFLQIFSGKFGNGCTYGFRRDGVYSASMGFHKNYTHYLATDKEVEQALIKEAKKRGFKEGVNFKLIEGGVGMLNSTKITKDYEIVYEASRNRLVLERIGILYTILKEGVWATIVEETITKEEAEKELGKIIID
tara:strand:+ start:1055 stop:1594 length:540 start_codon:yes stop_codon:yes gene_type:complete